MIPIFKDILCYVDTKKMGIYLLFLSDNAHFLFSIKTILIVVAHSNSLLLFCQKIFPFAQIVCL
jgi:hypothetical protein